MTRIALLTTALALGANAALAATPAATPTPPARSHAAVPARDDASADRMTKALNLLEANGYAAFRNFKSDGKDFTASVTKDGHNMTLLVDPDADKVTVES